jgi:lysophospholipase L1-like esterase
VISCPAAKTASSLDGNPIPVTYADPTVTGGQAPFTLGCTPVSGANYPVGATTVTCTVTDAQRRTSSCTFPVTVVVAPPPRLSVTTFVAFGDSITWGEDGRNTSLQSQSQPGRVRPAFRVADPYPEVLAQQLRSRYRTQSPTVANAGQPGEIVTDPGTLTRFRTDVPAGRYAVVLIMEGSNDVNLAVGDSTILVRAIDGLRRIVLDARSRGIRPYLATIPPERDGFRGKAQALVPGFNESVRGLAREQRVDLVDVYQALNADVNTYIGFDGLHPTPQGYVKIADTFFSVIRQTLETTPQTITSLNLGQSLSLGEWPPRTGSFATPVAAGPGSRAAERIPR